jgi:hypothetical protein
VTRTIGAVFGGGATTAVKRAGATLNAPVLVFATREMEMSADPAPTGWTVRVASGSLGPDEHRLRVNWFPLIVVAFPPVLAPGAADGVTVAAPVSLEATAKVAVADPVRLQPLLPSSPAEIT